MNEEKRPILAPQYMKKFHCIKEACEDICCIGRRIDIDHETWIKYRKIQHEELSPLLARKIARNRFLIKSKANYARIKLDQDCKCPFLSDKKLCRVQLEYGEGYLSDVCSTYPGVVNLINGVIERSATTSCPEAARLVLLQANPMEFVEDEEPASIRNIINNKVNTFEHKFDNHFGKYFQPLRSFTISALQCRKYRLWERLVILGIFYDSIKDAIKAKKANDISDLIATHTYMLEDGYFEAVTKGIPAQNTIQMKLLKEIVDKGYFSHVRNKSYLEYFSEFLIGLQYSKDSAAEEIGQRYNEAWQNYYEPYMLEHEYILENYLVNHVFKSLFPFTKNKSVFDSYIMLVIHYSLLKMNLIGLAGYHKGLTDDIVIKLIQSFSKAIEYNQLNLNKIADLIKQNGLNTMAFMSILIKN